MTQKFVTDEDVENDLRKQRSSENRTFSSNKHWKCRGKLRRFLSYMKAYKRNMFLFGFLLFTI